MLAISTALAPTLWADNQLNCTLTDETGAPVAKGLEVMLKASSGKDAGKEWKKKTNDKGMVEFKGLPDGSFILLGALEGYMLTNNGPIELAGNAKQTCAPSFVSLNKVNQLLTEANNAARTGNADLAIEKGKAAVEMVPSVPNTHLVLAIAYAKKGMVNEAVSSAQKAAELDPQQFGSIVKTVNMEALGTLAAAAMAKKDFDGAIAKYREVESLAPDDGVVHYNIAIAYGHKGDFENALKEIDRAIELSPDDAEFKQRKLQLQDMYLKSTEQMLVK
jgi:tetratricopeptide (TPR) repeat protein